METVIHNSLDTDQKEATRVIFPEDEPHLTKVYQAIEPNFLAKLPVPYPNGYELVAKVKTGAGFGESFALTNSIDKPWFEGNNPRVEVVKESRSTSVGDILEGPDGVLHLIEMFGHRILNDADLGG